jgi:MFS family permease
VAKTQFALLFAIMLVCWTVGVGLSPQLPVYATQLGAPPNVVGYYLAFNMLTLSLGSLAAGWLGDRLGRRKPIMWAAFLLSPPTLWAMGTVDQVLPLAILTGLLWFFGGLMIPASRSLLVLQVTSDQRGRMLGLLSMVVPLANLIGSGIIGVLADAMGYARMMRQLSLIYLLPLVLLFFLRDAPSSPATRTKAGDRSGGLPALVYLLLAGSLVISVGEFVSTLARSLIIIGRGYDATQIASISMMSGLVGLGVRPAMGWLSDRAGAAKVLLGIMAGAIVARLINAAGTELWHYWVAASITTVLGARIPIISSVACELAPRDSVGKALSLVAAAGWMGGVVGNSLGGNAVELLGSTGTLLAAAASVLVAAPLVLLALRQRAQGAAAPEPASASSPPA